jgi:hypothetical protein
VYAVCMRGGGGGVKDRRRKRKKQEDRRSEAGTVSSRDILERWKNKNNDNKWKQWSQSGRIRPRNARSSIFTRI